MTKKYKWNATPEAIRNIVILLVALIIVIVLIVSGIKKGINNIKTNKLNKENAATVQVSREAYEAENLSYPSGKMVAAVTTPLPTSVTDYAYVYAHKDKLPTGVKAQAQRNVGLTHFLYQLLSGDHPNVKTITFTPEELSAKIPVFYQWDERWGFTKYGNYEMGLNGASPTIASMVIVGLTGNTEATPRAMARFSETEGYYYEEYGTAWDMIPHAAESYGLSWYEVWLDEETVKDELDSGRAISLVVNSGHFTDDIGFILLTGYTDEGFTIVDPISMENTAQPWPWSDFQAEIAAIYSIGVVDDGE